MVELTEYTLVVLVSALFAVASIATYGAFSGLESRAEMESSFSTLETLASAALQNGSSKETILFPQSVLSCGGGKLGLASSSANLTVKLPLDCDFRFAVSSGAHTVQFSYRPPFLSAEVS